MEFYLSKAFNSIFTSINILFVIILAQIFIVLFLDSKKISKTLSKLFLIFFLFFGYTPLSNFTLNKIEDYIEPSRYPVNQLTGIVVLGSSFGSGSVSKERNEVSPSLRLIKALEIYKKNSKILIVLTGFSKEVNPDGWNDFEIAKKFFLDQGVRADNLIFESKSKNTFENSEFVRDIIKNYKGTWGLVTSASHMPRSFFVFKKQGIVLEPISVNFKTGTSRIFWLNFDILKGLSDWSIIFHEVAGLVYYKSTNKI